MNPSYIGCSYKIDRNIKVRCGQYLNEGDTGATFRENVMKIDMSLESFEYKQCEKGKKKKGKVIKKNTKKGIAYIKKNFVLKFITVDDNVSDNQVLLIERACISYYKPKYNRE